MQLELLQRGLRRAGPSAFAPRPGDTPAAAAAAAAAFTGDAPGPPLPSESAAAAAAASSYGEKAASRALAVRSWSCACS